MQHHLEQSCFLKGIHDSRRETYEYIASEAMYKDCTLLLSLSQVTLLVILARVSVLNMWKFKLASVNLGLSSIHCNFGEQVRHLIYRNLLSIARVYERTGLI